MKKETLILFLLVFTVKLNAHTIYVFSDTLDNKGVNSFDSLNIADNDTLRDTVITNVNTFISPLGVDDENKCLTRLNREEYSTEDYRSLSDVFSYLPFAFVQDLGSFGQPNEQMFYGLGFGNISYSRDGVLLNNRWQNSYNLNRLNNELIDSIEIAPITKGFLYSPYNNPVSIGINNRFNFPFRAITQLKFFQASFDEGFVDVLFHTPVTKKISFGINVSNSAIDSRFANSDYESWKLNTQINYKVNDKININATYYFIYDTLALFGGLDTNKMLNDNFSPVLYETVNYTSSRYQLTYNNNASIKILALLIPNSKTDLTLYFNSSSQKFFQNKDALVNYIPIIVDGNYHQTFGASLRNYYKQSYFSLDVIANYESTTFDMDLNNINYTQNIFTLSGEMKILNKFKYFIPSVFGKLNKYNEQSIQQDNNETLFGFGADVTGVLNRQISYYAGVSWFQQRNIILKDYTLSYPEMVANLNTVSDNHSMEVGLNFNFKTFSGKLSYFNYTSNNRAVPNIYQQENDSLLVNEYSNYINKDVKNNGVNFSFNFKFWKILFSNNLSYYFSSQTERVYASPDYAVAGKIYYLDYFFENNLYLKAGINYRITGEQIPFVYDFEKLQQVTGMLTPLVHYQTVPSSYQLNLYVAGTIQERATIFITLENLLDTDYYIAPYYFKQPITLKFGVTWLLFD